MAIPLVAAQSAVPRYEVKTYASAADDRRQAGRSGVGGGAASDAAVPVGIADRREADDAGASALGRAGLYVGFDADDADITAQFQQRDDPTYRDDAVEIFINPNPQQEVVYYGFEMNARGVLYDYLNYNSRTLFKRFDATGVKIATSCEGR
jgi:hypothetical protein